MRSRKRPTIRSESQSISGYGVIKVFFQKGVNIAAAMAQVTASSQTVLKLLPPGITPPYVLSYNASSVPILQLALSSRALPQMKLFDLGQNFIRPQFSTVQGASPLPVLSTHFERSFPSKSTVASLGATC